MLQLGPGRQLIARASRGARPARGTGRRGEGPGRGRPDRGVGRSWPKPDLSQGGDWGCGDTTTRAEAATDSSGWGGSITGGAGVGAATLAWIGTVAVGVGRSTGGGAGSGRDRSGSANSSVLTPSTITSPSACAVSTPPCAGLHPPGCRGNGDGGLPGPFPIRFTAGQVDQATGGILPGRFPTDVPEVLQVA